MTTARRLSGARQAVLALALTVVLSACSVPFLADDDAATENVPNDPTDLVQGLEELAAQPALAADVDDAGASDTADLETQASALVQAEDLQQVTVDDLDEDFLVAMREIRLAHPVLGIFNDTDMLRIAQGTCGTLAHQASYDPVVSLIDEQVELANLSELAATGVEDWVYTSSEVFCPVTVGEIGR